MTEKKSQSSRRRTSRTAKKTAKQRSAPATPTADQAEPALKLIAPPDETYVLEVTLQDTEPRIWRRIEAPADLTLADLHALLQMVMGWTNSHMHQFHTRDGRRFVEPVGDHADAFGWMDDAESTYDITLADLHKELKEDGVAYEYDMGDGWMHLVTLIDARPRTDAKAKPVCLDGEAACPPDNCGGIPGFYNLLDIIKDPSHDEHDDMMEWLGGAYDPDAFDVEQINALLRRYF